METTVLTSQQVFFLPQHLMVPLFQRPYVWDEVDQWQPLWQDIARICDLRLRAPWSTARHFLGAVVLQANDLVQGTVPTKNVIDGQQRITSLQLLTDATTAVLTDAGVDNLAGQLTDLTHNRSYQRDDPPTLKLKHTNRDREAFQEVMNAELPVEHGELVHSGSLIVRAHAFFCDAVSEWLGDPTDSGFMDRAQALAHVLGQGLQVVVIDLQAEENSQEIFETLNARGTPLTAADLIKNFVFQRLEAEGVDTAKAYAEDWPFESDFWEADVSVGRVTMTRGSLFLGQWLSARLGEEISPKQTFNRFKHYVEHEATAKMLDLLSAIKAQAQQYQAWTIAAADATRVLTPVERAAYRMQCAGIELLKPVLIWLHDPELGIPRNVADDVIGHFESWVVRRQLLRLTSAQLGAVVADVIRTHRTAPVAELGQRVRLHLSRLSVASTYWPGDDEVRSHLRTEQVYRRYPRARLRMYLEAVEDGLRAVHRYPSMPRTGNPIEHVLPQKWRANWPVDGLEAEVARSEHVHRLGNLTLLTQSLNSTISNGPWSGPNGKRSHITQHDVFLMNRPFQQADVWDEAAIDDRSEKMIDSLLETWPVPEGHVGRIDDPVEKAQAWVELKHLVAAGLLEAGTRLRSSSDEGAAAVVTEGGAIESDGRLFKSPSGAATHVRGRHTNGWYYWRLHDGRRLLDVRAEYRGETPAAKTTGPDWSRLHQILELLPMGRWTTADDLADAIGTARHALSEHVADCPQCTNSSRVLTRDGTATESSLQGDGDARNAIEMLQEEGVAIVSGKADPDRRLSSDDLAELINERRAE